MGTFFIFVLSRQNRKYSCIPIHSKKANSDLNLKTTNIMANFPFWSIFKAIIVNGRYASSSVLFIQDLNSKNINCIVPSRAVYPDDGTNTLVETFEFNVFQPKSLNLPVVFRTTLNDFGGVTIDDVLAYYVSLATYGTTQWMRKYTSLVAIDLRNLHKAPVGQGGAQANGWKNILLNDFKVVNRQFLPASFALDSGEVVDVTNIYVDMGNESDLKIFTVLGDQTYPSGTEYDAYY